MRLQFLHKLILSITLISLMQMAMDLRFSCFMLIPIFLSVFNHHPPIFLLILLCTGFCEDVFFGKWLGVTPLLYVIFKSLFERFSVSLLKLENFYILWLCFSFATCLYQGLQFYIFTMKYGYVNYSPAYAMWVLLPCLIFPLVFKKFLSPGREIYGS